MADREYDEFEPELPDPYGHCGMDPEPQWSGEWSSWTDSQRTEYLGSLDRVCAFNKHQIVDILQGFPPRPVGWDSPTTYLVENEGPVQRFLFDVSTGAIPPTLTRGELAAWCGQRGVPLPDLIADVAAPLVHDELAQSVIAGPFPAWVPLPPEVPRDGSRKRSRGRPKSAGPRNQAIVEMATDYVMKRARGGLRTKLSEAVKHIASTTSHRMTVDTIRRTLTGKLPLAQAKALADSAAARTSGAEPIET